MKAIFEKLKHNLIKNAYFLRKRIFSVIFIAFILIYSIYSAVLNRDALKDALGTFRQEAADNPNELQTEVATLQNTMLWIKKRSTILPISRMRPEVCIIQLFIRMMKMIILNMQCV